jgi:RNA-binding protein YlmH
MEDLKSNAEIRAEVSDWVLSVRNRLDLDRTEKLVILGPFRDPWTIALTISELKEALLRFRELAPYHGARMRCIQVTHYQNLLDWPEPHIQIIRASPENLFDPPSRAEMLEILERYVGPDASIGDAVKIESGWAVVINNALDIPSMIPGFTVRYLNDDGRKSLPPSTPIGEKGVSVASPRIDAVAAAVLKPSREKIKKHLESGGVLLNYRRESKPGRELAAGDVVAVRGAGRFRVVEITGHSKKGRVLMDVEIINGP